MSSDAGLIAVQVLIAVLLGVLMVASMNAMRVRARREDENDALRWTIQTANSNNEALAKRADDLERRLKSIDPIRARVCGSCLDGYGSKHHCEVPDHCDCDNTHRHTENLPGLPFGQKTLDFLIPPAKYIEPGAEPTVAPLLFAKPTFEPSKDFVAPDMRLDGPPDLGSHPGYDVEEIYELGSEQPVDRIATCNHEGAIVNVYLLDNETLVGWICERCGADGRYPW